MKKMILIANSSGGGIAGTLDASYWKGQGERQGVEREYIVVSYQDKVGTLSPGAHAGSYNGQDAYNDMLVTEKRNGIFTSEVRAIQTERQGISSQTEGLQGLDRPHSEGGVQHNE